MRPYFYPAYPVPYWYNPYVPKPQMIKYADTSWWQNVTPYLQAGGIGAGIGALGGAGVGALRGRGDWKKALKSALVGMVAGAVVGPAAYAGYRALFPASTPAPEEISILDALYIIEKNPEIMEDWVRWGQPYDRESLQAILGYHGKNVRIRNITTW
jgi:hypothetical protein